MRSMVFCAALVLATGCGNEETPPEPTEGTAPEAEPGPRVSDPTFELVATPAAHYAVSQAGTFEIRLTPRGQYHVNVDPNFPFAIALAGPAAVRFAERALDRADAAEFTEQRARIAVPFTPQAAGSHRVTATVDFAVCTPTTCMPENRTLALVLPVE